MLEMSSGVWAKKLLCSLVVWQQIIVSFNLQEQGEQTAAGACVLWALCRHLTDVTDDNWYTYCLQLTGSFVSIVILI